MKRRYVIHRHDASRLHWDLRLEKDGVLKSWAVPKEPSMDPLVKRLAIEVEDHELTYADFEGVIEEGYGKGEVKIWDSGTYQELYWKDSKITVILDGERLTGKFALIKSRYGKSGKGQWLFFKTTN